MNALSASGLADLAGVTEADVQRLVDLGILVARDGADPFLAADAPNTDDRLTTHVRLAQQNGLDRDAQTALMILLAGYLGYAHASLAMETVNKLHSPPPDAPTPSRRPGRRRPAPPGATAPQPRR